MVCVMRVRHWVYRAKVDWKSVKGPYIRRVPIADLRALLEYDAMADPETQKRFEGWARGEYRDIRFEVDLAIARKLDRHFSISRYGYPNLKRFFKEADRLEKTGKYTEAALIYKGLTESIGVHMDFIPDKSGQCCMWMEEALKEMAKCILAADLDDEQRRKEIRYAAEWSMRVIDWFGDSYAELLDSICLNEKDLDIWEEVLDDPPKVEDGYSGPSYITVQDGRKVLERRRAAQTPA